MREMVLGSRHMLEGRSAMPEAAPPHGVLLRVGPFTNDAISTGSAQT